jgi:hypothetical protein
MCGDVRCMFPYPSHNPLPDMCLHNACSGQCPRCDVSVTWGTRPCQGHTKTWAVKHIHVKKCPLSFKIFPPDNNIAHYTLISLKHCSVNVFFSPKKFTVWVRCFWQSLYSTIYPSNLNRLHNLMFVDPCITVHLIKKKSNKMQQRIKILLFLIYMKLDMFRATHRPSSGA